MSGKSPSGALSPYYYKGGYFHGIHYGSYFDDAESLYKMIEKEEHFILESPERRRIMIDLYETSLTPEVLEAESQNRKTIHCRGQEKSESLTLCHEKGGSIGRRAILSVHGYGGGEDLACQRPFMNRRIDGITV